MNSHSYIFGHIFNHCRFHAGHDHDHDHEHCHEDHAHCPHHHSHAPVGGGDGDPRAEIVALMKYMVDHNEHHAHELLDLARKIDELGDHSASEQVMTAVSDFEKGNMRLSVVLSAIDINK